MLRCAFVLLVAVLAAALADPLMEFASNVGMFGAGHFTDGSNWDVLPALVIAGLACGAVATAQVAKLVVGFGFRAAGFVDAFLPTRVVARLLPIAFALQIGTLFGMESIEQIVIRGHLLGGTIWLGGPVLVSLLVHAVMCVLVAMAALRMLHSFTRAAERIIISVLRPISCIAHELSQHARQSRANAIVGDLICVLAHLRERAPPLLAT